MALTAWVPLPLAKISTATGAVPTTTPAAIESLLLPDTSSEMYLGLLDFGAVGLDHFFGNVTGGELVFAASSPGHRQVTHNIAMQSLLQQYLVLPACAQPLILVRRVRTQ